MFHVSCTNLLLHLNSHHISCHLKMKCILLFSFHYHLTTAPTCLGNAFLKLESLDLSIENCGKNEPELVTLHVVRSSDGAQRGEVR
jgi:hypothetical protein